MVLNDRKMTANPLRLREDGGFRILELHGAETTPESAENIRGRIAALLDETKPDLVYLTGDNVAGIEDVETLKRVLPAVVGPIEERGIEWTHVFGDMDRRGGLEAEAQLPVYQSYPHCHTIAGPEDLDGCGNYLLPVLQKNGEPAFVLWGMDTGCEIGVYEQKYHSPTRARLAAPLYTEHYMDGIHMCHTMWYWHTSKALEAEYGRLIPGLMFFHVSTQEHSIIPMNETHAHMTGVMKAQVVCSVVCAGMWSAVFERKDVVGIYCGHTRGEQNNFVGDYGGVRLGLSAAFKDGPAYYRVFDYKDGKFTGSV